MESAAMVDGSIFWTRMMRASHHHLGASEV